MATAQKSRASSSILFPSRRLVLVPFRFGSVLVAVPCFREASKEESLKFELTVILNFGQNSESEFVFKRIIGIGIRNEYFLK